jgi:hypothetical protein
LKYRGIKIKSKTTRTPKRTIIVQKAALYFRICGHTYLNIFLNENITPF